MTNQTFDANRAVAILNVAKKNGLYPAPLPESDQDKIMEAEGIVAQAQQAAKVANEVGKGQVPHYDACMQVLFEADVTGGSEPERHPESASSSPEPTDEERAIAASMPDGQVVTDEEIIEARFDSGATWESDDGTEWIIDKNPTSLQVEVYAKGTEERTTVPLGFLKRKVADPPQGEEPSDKPSPQPPEQPQQPPSPTQASQSSSGGGSPPGETTAEPSPVQPSSAQQPAESASPSAPSSEVPVDDDEGDPEYRALLDKVELDYRRAQLPLPADVQDPPQMPEDLSAEADAQVQKLHSQFNACAARAHYLLGLERQKVVSCRRLEHQALKPAMRTARENLGKDASVTEVTHEAEDHPGVSKWSDRVELHADRFAAYEDLFKIYTENVSVLSRDWTMRSSDEAGS